MKKDNQRIKNIKNKIENIVNSFDWETFENDRLTCLAKWQYYESIDLTNEDRYELDKEAYIRTFFNNIYNTTHEFDETTCIVFLLNQMKDVKHPIFLQYLKYLEKLLITIEPKIVLNDILENYDQYVDDIKRIKTRIENRNNIIDDESITLINTSILAYNEISKLGFNSIYEVKDLLFKGNSSLLIDKIHNDYNDFKTWLSVIENVNTDISVYLPLNGHKILSFQNSEKDIYKPILSYVKLHNSLFTFFEPIIELLPEKIDKYPLIDFEPKQTEIIIALNELEIFDYLKNKYPTLKTSANRMANVIHLITGKPTKSLVSTINTMYSPKQKHSKNNPYNSPRIVEKVKERLNKQLPN